MLHSVWVIVPGAWDTYHFKYRIKSLKKQILKYGGGDKVKYPFQPTVISAV